MSLQHILQPSGKELYDIFVKSIDAVTGTFTNFFATNFSADHIICDDIKFNASPTLLNYYEDSGDIVGTWSGPWTAATTPGTIRLIRVGKLVTMYIGFAGENQTNTNNPAQFSEVIPNQFLKGSSLNYLINIVANDLQNNPQSYATTPPVNITVPVLGSLDIDAAGIIKAGGSPQSVIPPALLWPLVGNGLTAILATSVSWILD